VAEILERIHSSPFNAFTVVLDEPALAAARKADKAVARGGPLPPLLGVPVSVKDHIWMAGVPATNGSLAYRDFVPAEDCVAVARLRAAGAVIVGKTNNPEFCYRGFTDNALFGPTRNPWDPSRTPGGSSGGAAAAVAAGLGPLAIGTDGGGSIRIPASFCGVVGHKPTHGRVPNRPGFKAWPSLSVDGPLTRSVRDAALMLSVLSDPSSPDAGPGAAGRIAYSEDLGGLPVDADVRAVFRSALEVFAGLGYNLVEAHPETAHPTDLWNRIALPEGYQSEGPLLESFRDVMTPGIAELIEAGRGLVPPHGEMAAYARVWDAFFTGYDLLLTPTMQLTAFPVGIETPESIEGRPVDPFFDDWCTTCLPANLAGIPATSVPAGFDRSGLPIGLQIMGPRWADRRCLSAASAFEHEVTWRRFTLE
jgi:Asp-tRNA(Asn)/Glu-tRNA(Gln) amidotransferase A subunit family amidase